MRLNSSFKESELPCFLVGSGVSLDWPSCQPTGLQFTQKLISHLIPEGDQEAILALTQSDGAKSFLRFEALLQEIQRWDPELRVLDSYASCDRPNANHENLARFIAAGCDVFTTNFDGLLEAALFALKKSKKHIAPVIYRQDWTRRRTKSDLSVYKLHGSLVDFRDGGDARSSVQATLRQIANGKRAVFQLEEWKRKCFAVALKRDDLVVVGYSGLDDFDVLPTLRYVESVRRIVWVEHTGGIAVEDAQLESVSSTSSGSPSGITEHLLQSFLEFGREPGTMYRLRVDTKQFLHAISMHYFNEASPSMTEETCTSDADKTPSEAFAMPEELRFSEGEKALLAGQIYSYVNTAKADEVLRRGLESAGREDNVELMADLLLMIGRQSEAMMSDESTTNQERLAFWRRAHADYDEVLALLDGRSEREDLIKCSMALSNIGYLYTYRENEQARETAVSYYQRALKISLDVEDDEGVARARNNMGAVAHAQGRMSEAREHWEYACQIDRKLGDLAFLATHLGNLGLVCVQMGDATGEGYLDESLEIATQLGSSTMMANTLHTMATYREARGEYALALDHCREALESAERAGSTLAGIIRVTRDRIRNTRDAR